MSDQDTRSSGERIDEQRARHQDLLAKLATRRTVAGWVAVYLAFLNAFVLAPASVNDRLSESLRETAAFSTGGALALTLISWWAFNRWNSNLEALRKKGWR